MPLPRLQTISDESVTFLYAINRTQSVRQPDVGRYQRGEGGPFDNRIHLRAGVGEALVRLNHLLRPLIHHQWAVKVATLNRLDEYQLERFLFGAERVPLECVRGPIIELQEGRCFYCAERLASRAVQTPDVDHFIPWSRYPDDGLEKPGRRARALQRAEARPPRRGGARRPLARPDAIRIARVRRAPPPGRSDRLDPTSRADARRGAGALPPPAGGRSALAAGRGVR